MAQQRSLEGARVLIVEDEYFMADDLAKALKAAGAVTVGPVGSLKEANALLGRGSVDAAILDINLGGEMAYPLIERLRASNIPCFIVSGYGEDSLAESVRGIPTFEKPVAQSTIVSMIRDVLSRTPG
ncbi:MAG TPA: response regulator [Sphingomicrobium sp.]|jgi:DNA-binding response OmpR family regulator|nr:response regulator [Sphingomicrobium sp.]